MSRNGFVQNSQMPKYATIGERETHYAMRNKQELMATKSSSAFGALTMTTNNQKGNWMKDGCRPQGWQPFDLLALF